MNLIRGNGVQQFYSQQLYKFGPIEGYRDFLGCKVTRTSGISLNNSATTISWQSELFDTANMWASASPQNLYVHQTGLWMAVGHLALATTTGHNTDLKIAYTSPLNVGATLAFQRCNFGAGTSTIHNAVSISGTVYAEAGGYFTLIWTNGSGTSITTETGESGISLAVWRIA